MNLYSVVIPVYNSAVSLEELYARIHSAFKEFGSAFEVIFVDDYSEDSSWRVLQDLKVQFPETVKLIRFARNYGQHSATFCGFQHAKGDFVISLDDDLQNAPEDIPKLIQKQRDTLTELVYGIGGKQQTFWRKMGSGILRSGSKLLEGGPHKGSSFRLLSRSLVDQVLQHNRHFIFLDEVLFWYTNEIAFETVPHYSRPNGSSGYSLRKLLGLVARSTLFYSTWPLKVMTLGGLFLSSMSFIAGLTFVILKFVYDVPVRGFTALMVTILFSTSLILLCFGVIGGYIKHIFIVLNSKPMYSIAQKNL
ncbi:MAG: glycosyltransferase involved in cell wall biosynthesis [Flavobacteriales bacterium]|jgi:glycosyltransferase involved in cell wall biosynthesis